ncbi:MAG: hypothetical protein AAGH64_11690, partial [Planctomycetota bacterium]
EVDAEALAAPFEDLASRFDADAGAQLARLRRALAPAGRADADLRFSVEEGADPSYALRLEPRSDLSLNAGGRRWVAHQPDGVVTATTDGATFERFSAAIGVEGGERFSTTLDGVLALDGGSGALDVRTDAVRLGSSTARAVIDGRLRGVDDTLETLGVVDAVFDLEASIRFEGGGAEADWVATPDAIDLNRAGVRTETTATGAIEGDPERVRIDGLSLGAEAWDLRIDGERRSDGTGAFMIEADAPAVTDSLLSLLPVATGNALRGLELDASGGLTLRDATLTLSPDSGPVLDGAIGYRGLSARVGVPVGEGVGTGAFVASEESFRVDLAFDRVELARVGVTGATVSAERTAPGEPLVVRTLRGSVHEGLLMGRGVVRTSTSPVTYEFSAELASVRFGGVLEDLEIAGEGESVERGLMDAGVLMRGRLDGTADRRGRITARVQDGRVLDLPGIIPLLELANLQPPSNEEVDLAYLDLFVGGDTAHVDRLTMFSNSLRIAGIGRVDIPTLGVDLSFSTYGSNYVPILSTLIEGLREELASIRVTGTLASPEFRTEQLRSTRALLDAIAGGPTTDTPRSERAEPGAGPEPQR